MLLVENIDYIKTLAFIIFNVIGYHWSNWSKTNLQQKLEIKKERIRHLVIFLLHELYFKVIRKPWHSKKFLFKGRILVQTVEEMMEL